MSLPPRPVPPVPELITRGARAAFPKGISYLRLRDQLGPDFRDGDFADLYPRRGPPAPPPWRLTLGTVMQFAESLSNRQAAAVRGRTIERLVGSMTSKQSSKPPLLLVPTGTRNSPSSTTVTCGL